MMNKKNVIIFGGKGLIGNTLMQSHLLTDKYELINLDLSVKKNSYPNFKCDVLKNKEIESKINKKQGINRRI